MTRNKAPLFQMLVALCAILITALSAAPDAQAQSLFAPAIRVNDKVITGYELEQRKRMLQVFRQPGDPDEEARKQLIEERLKLDAAEALGIKPSDDDIAAGMEEFAGRANLTTEQFTKALAQAGVATETYRDFIYAGVAWRQLVRAKFGPKVIIGENDVDRALAANAASSIEVLLSEIYIPVRPGQEAAAQARAQEISNITTLRGFAQAARRYSAAATRGRGGKLNWLPLNKVPPAIRGPVLGLAPGQVTKPLPIPGAIALFQLRAIKEGKPVEPDYQAIDYAAYYIPGGHSEKAMADAAKIRNQIDTCDDLYGIAKGQPPEVLERVSKAPAEIPRDIAFELAKLDKGEVSTTLTRAGGQTLVFLMLCDRVVALPEDVSRENVSLSLQNQRLESYSESYLQQLRSEARIIEK